MYSVVLRKSFQKDRDTVDNGRVTRKRFPDGDRACANTVRRHPLRRRLCRFGAQTGQLRSSGLGLETGGPQRAKRVGHGTARETGGPRHGARNGGAAQDRPALIACPAMPGHALFTIARNVGQGFDAKLLHNRDGRVVGQRCDDGGVGTGSLGSKEAFSVFAWT